MKYGDGVRVNMLPKIGWIYICTMLQRPEALLMTFAATWGSGYLFTVRFARSEIYLYAKYQLYGNWYRALLPYDMRVVRYTSRTEICVEIEMVCSLNS